jgi:threonine/homoserine efflux transporter RhtA
MRYTTVATGTALTCLQPIFAALFVSLSGHLIPRRSWGGMAIAFLSVLLITGLDLSLSTKYFYGDVAGILAGALAAGYMLTSAKAQRNISTSTFAVSLLFNLRTNFSRCWTYLESSTLGVSKARMDHYSSFNFRGTNSWSHYV